MPPYMTVGVFASRQCEREEEMPKHGTEGTICSVVNSGRNWKKLDGAHSIVMVYDISRSEIEPPNHGQEHDNIRGAKVVLFGQWTQGFLKKNNNGVCRVYIDLDDVELSATPERKEHWRQVLGDFFRGQNGSTFNVFSELGLRDIKPAKIRIERPPNANPEIGLPNYRITVTDTGNSPALFGELILEHLIDTASQDNDLQKRANVGRPDSHGLIQLKPLPESRWTDAAVVNQPPLALDTANAEAEAQYAPFTWPPNS